jgi:hypothetical protein
MEVFMKHFFGILCSAAALLVSGATGGLHSLLHSLEASDTLTALFRHPAWIRFKAFWRQIGRIDPRKQTAPSLTPEAPYAGAINQARHQELTAELERCSSELVQSGISEEDRQTLVHLLTERLANMLTGPHSMFMRMVPSANLLRKERSLQQLEARIDVLERLREEERISDPEYKRALDALQEEVLTIDVIRLVEGSYGEYWTRDGRDWAVELEQFGIVERQLRLLELHFDHLRAAYLGQPDAQEKLAALDTKYAAARRDLTRFRERMPRLAALVAELQR